MNEWAAEAPRVGNLLLTRYEDLRADPAKELARLLRWMGETPDPALIREAVDFASFENLKKLEQRAAFTGHRRLTPGAADNPDSYKVRRAKVGGFRDYFDDDQVATIEAYIQGNLDPGYGYGPSGTNAPQIGS
jgi:alcohol sulfotransferase